VQEPRQTEGFVAYADVLKSANMDFTGLILHVLLNFSGKNYCQCEIRQSNIVFFFLVAEGSFKLSGSYTESLI
jgi:hypothetical protein